MKWTDRFLQRWRSRKVVPFIKPGVLFRQAPQLAPDCMGIDPTLAADVKAEKFTLVPDLFSERHAVEQAV